LTGVAVFPRPCDGASGAPDVTNPAVSNRLKTSTFRPAPTLASQVRELERRRVNETLKSRVHGFKVLAEDFVHG